MIFNLKRAAGEKDLRRLPTVKFDTELVTESVKQDLKATVAKADEIPVELKLQVTNFAVSMVQSGGDLGSFCKAVAALGVAGLSKNDIAELARFLQFRSMSLISRNRMVDAGISEVEWLYSGAPCDGSIEQNALHKAANRSRFAVADGLKISGVPTWPGRERGCKCTMKPIIKGFS